MSPSTSSGYEQDFNLDVNTLAGDLRDWLLGRLRHMPRTWRELPEHEQRDITEAAEAHARELIRRVVELVASEGQPVIRATLGDVAVKSKGIIEAKLGVSRFDEHRHQLADAAGMPVMITVADAQRFFGERAPAAVDPDAPTLPLDNGEDVRTAAALAEADADRPARGRSRGRARENARASDAS